MPSWGTRVLPSRAQRFDNREHVPQERRGVPLPDPDQVIKGMINRATMLATLIIGLIAGPAVSL
jgi:hypothetical protein